ncbi:hypothetical protein Hanom_Chr00s000001g01596911 [Helianthus anomalus]
MQGERQRVRIVTKSSDGGEEGWYETIFGNFCVPDVQALEALIAPGPGILDALRANPAATECGKAQKTKRQEKPAVLVSKQTGTGILHPRKTLSEYYVLVSNTLEGLDILWAKIGIDGLGASTGVSGR